MIVLLAGGDKSMRKNDINIAVAPAKNSCDPPWVPVWTWRSSRSGRQAWRKAPPAPTALAESDLSWRVAIVDWATADEALHRIVPRDRGRGAVQAAWAQRSDAQRELTTCVGITATAAARFSSHTRMFAPASCLGRRKLTSIYLWI